MFVWTGQPHVGIVTDASNPTSNKVYASVGFEPPAKGARVVPHVLEVTDTAVGALSSSSEHMHALVTQLWVKLRMQRCESACACVHEC